MLKLFLSLDGLSVSALLVRLVATHYPRCTGSKHTRTKMYTSRWKNIDIAYQQVAEHRAKGRSMVLAGNTRQFSGCVITAH